jgi:RNA polymerase sigma-70 factor (ECF subfamily)
VATRARSFRDRKVTVQPVLVNGAPGFISWAPEGHPLSVLAFTVRGGRITQIDVIAKPDRLAALGLQAVRS